MSRVSRYDNGVRCQPAFKLVIFDNNSVLVDSEPHAQRVTAAPRRRRDPPVGSWGPQQSDPRREREVSLIRTGHLG